VAICVEGIWARRRGVEHLFAWERLGALGNLMLLRTTSSRPVKGDPQAWQIGPWPTHRRGVFGVAILVPSGHPSVAAFKPTWPLRGLLHPWLYANAIPIRLDVGSYYDPPTSTLYELMALLTRFPEWRARLGEPARATALAEALSTRCVASRPPRTGVRRRTVEILGALGRGPLKSGLPGSGERPVSGDPSFRPARIVAEVEAALDRNPFVEALHITHDEVAGTLHRQYLDLEPWPFESLVSEVWPPP
jgi:hypothetical protein